MLRAMAGYWRAVARTAFTGTCAALGLQSGPQVVLRLGIGAALILALLLWGSPDAASDEFVVRVTFVFLVVLVFPVVFLWKMVSTPASLHDDLVGRLGVLEQRLTPQMRVSVPDRGISVGVGTTNETMTGRRQTVFTDDRHVVVVHCTNASASVIKSCVARLVGAWREEGDGSLLDLGVVESVGLSWSRAGGEFLTSFQAGETKSVYVSIVHPQGYMALFRKIDEYPIEYHQLFSTPGKYRIRIQIDGDDDLALSFLVAVETEAAAYEPLKLARAKVKVAILDQGAPPQSP